MYQLQQSNGEVFASAEVPANVRALIEASEARQGAWDALGSDVVEWAQPDWTFAVLAGSNLIASAHLVLREVRSDQGEFRVAGVHRLLTQPEHRHKGFGTGLLLQAMDHGMRRLDASACLVLCAPVQAPFFLDVGWVELECPVFFSQESSGIRRWNGKTLWTTREPHARPRSLDLLGRPW